MLRSPLVFSNPFRAIATSPRTNVANLTVSINVSPTISTLFYSQSASRPLLNESNENKILVSSRITDYAFSQTALRYSMTGLMVGRAFVLVSRSLHCTSCVTGNHWWVLDHIAKPTHKTPKIT
jgi:hypothetical protein